MPMPLKLTEDQSKEVCRRYLDGENGAQLAKAFDTCDSTVYNIMKRRGVPRRSAGVLTSEQDIEIADRYKTGESTLQLAMVFGVSDRAIRNALDRQDTPRRTLHEARTKYPFNEAAFDIVTEDAAYWVGFLMADGCVERKKGNSARIAICLSIRDYEHLKLFRSFIQSSHPIRTWRQAVHIEIYSVYMANALALFGVVPHKTFSAQVARLENNRHFWRGVIDGDGTLKYYRRQKSGWKSSYLELCGSKPLMRQFAEFVQTHIACKKVLIRPQGTIHRVALSGSSAIKIVHLLYHPCAVSLTRKQNSANQFPPLLL